jgi:predicted alpha/beta-hydrolase family hydrolase
VLAHGASGNAASMRRHVEGLQRRGLEARAIDVPVRKAEDAIERYAAVAGPLPDRIIGGQSYGGRVASLLAAATGADGPAGLVLFSYPLHRPGSPERETRTAHWTAIRCPVLFLSGEADPFARIDLLRSAVAELLPAAELLTWPRLGHSLTSVLDAALDRVAAFVAGLPGGTAAPDRP